MTCAKQVVTARIVTTSGLEFHGSNYCNNPQEACPRGDLPSKVGYWMCRDICDQPAHAEVNAILAAGELAEGSTLYLHGHIAVCPTCMAACNAAGIAKIEVIG